jgi:hypothetical protein
MVRFSLITATRDDSSESCTWLRSQASDETEVIIVPNPGRCGLGEAYNEGLAQAHGEYCCFLHDDVTIDTPDWFSRLAQAVDRDGFDLVGVAGSTVLPGNGAWWEGGSGSGRGVVWHRAPDGALDRSQFGPPEHPHDKPCDVVCLDGVLLFARRRDFVSHPFDTEWFDGFHFYDSDLCLRWLMWHDRRLGVVANLRVIHDRGATLVGWQEYLNRFHDRHAGVLPLSLQHVPVWQANLAALRAADPKLAELLCSDRRPGRLVNLREAHGRAVTGQRGPQAVTILDPTIDSSSQGAKTTVLLGAGSGIALDHLVARECHTCVIEPEAHLLCWLLCRFDWSEALRAGRLQFIVPSVDLRECAEVSLHEQVSQWQRRVGREPDAVAWLSTGSTEVNRSFFAALTPAAALPTELSRRVAAWPQGGGASFDVTVISPNCPIFNNLAAEFERLGLSTRLLRIPDHPSRWTRTGRLHVLRQLMESPSRAVVMRNRVLFETSKPSERLALARHVPGRLVGWWWDVPNVSSRIDIEAEAAVVEDFAFARGILPVLGRSASWLPPAARREFFDFEHDDRPPEPVVSFVGNSRFDALQANLNVVANVLAWYCGRVGRRLVESVNQSRGMTALYGTLTRLDSQVAAALNGLPQAMANQCYYANYLWQMCTTAAFRLAAIERLANLPIVVFGDDGWVRSGAVPAEKFRGYADARSLPQLYHRSRLNLNVNFMQVSTTINPKVFDVCAAGGLVLTDPRPELAELFPNPSCRPFTFASLDELSERVCALLETDTEALRQKLREHVRASHTLERRAAELAERLQFVPGRH